MDNELLSNEKLENLLNLSLQSTEKEREQSGILGTGYDALTKQWELIVKYSGDIQRAASENIIIEELLAGYAIVTIRQDLIRAFAELDEVEYIEVPKQLYFEQIDGRSAICLSGVSDGGRNLTGQGVVVGIVDSGIEYQNPEFLDGNGKSRILALWDQTLIPDQENNLLPPEGFATGVLFTKEMLDDALETGRTVSIDSSGHGTAVASVAVGSRIGVAPKADLLVVKLGNPIPGAFPRTTQLMRAMSFLVEYARKRNRPLTINLSFGNVYGNHLGSSLLERFMDNVSEVGRTVICVGSGNEAASNGHVEVNITQATTAVEWSVGRLEPNLNMQLWKSYADTFQIVLIAPNGDRLPLLLNQNEALRFQVDETDILAYFGSPLPYSDVQELFLEFLPVRGYLPEGIWRLEITGIDIKNGLINLYLPSYSARNEATGFFRGEPEATFTIPSTARRMITVGAYDPVFDAYAPFSGRGYSTEGQQGAQPLLTASVKPELVAPGVNVLAAAVGGGYEGYSGTSFATPYVTGASALLMEWGIVQRNDRFLYGEKVKAYLVKGAKPLRGILDYPDARVGWGALCVRDSFPERN